ncbi:MAG: hypothetical protein CVU39_07930 [Chloroflexi bacterium HGW-Chloroflexi-10]|nr:MAG: hypothetical protein CVU39_07930 [Chloroflexi bacterium HGW-Chloroflexi-10]
MDRIPFITLSGGEGANQAALIRYIPGDNNPIRRKTSVTQYQALAIPTTYTVDISRSGGLKTILTCKSKLAGSF